MATTTAPFSTLAGIVASAAGAVVATLLLFNSFLKDLVPPIGGAQLSIGMVSFATTIVLLALSLLIRKRISAARQQGLAVLSLFMLSLAFAAFFVYRDVVRDYVYDYPPGVAPSQQRQHIRGEWHATGRVRREGKSVAEAVKQFGGPELVVGHELLWSETSQREVTSMLERWYMVLSMLLTVALFVVAITVWRSMPAESHASKPPGTSAGT